MIGEILSGVQFLFEAVSSGEEKSAQYRRDLLTNFIEPIRQQIDGVHKGYLATFQQYRTMIQSGEHPLTAVHPVFDKMQEDHALSNMDRAQLVAMSEHLQVFRSDVAKQMAEEPAGRFAQDVIAYITTPADSLDKRYRINAARQSTFVNLQRIFGGDGPDTAKRKKALEMIDGIVSDLQDQYIGITKAYLKLKADLLA